MPIEPTVSHTPTDLIGTRGMRSPLRSVARATASPASPMIAFNSDESFSSPLNTRPLHLSHAAKPRRYAADLSSGSYLLESSNPTVEIMPANARAVYAPRLKPTMWIESPASYAREMNV